MQEPVQPKKKSPFARLKELKKHSKHGKRAFYIWIGYQCIKGTLTTSLIWIPLIYSYFHHK